MTQQLTISLSDLQSFLARYSSGLFGTAGGLDISTFVADVVEQINLLKTKTINADVQAIVLIPAEVALLQDALSAVDISTITEALDALGTRAAFLEKALLYTTGHLQSWETATDADIVASLSRAETRFAPALFIHLEGKVTQYLAARKNSLSLKPPL